MVVFAWILWVLLIIWFLALSIDLIIQINKYKKTHTFNLSISWGILIDIPMFVFLSILIFGGIL